MKEKEAKLKRVGRCCQGMVGVGRRAGRRTNMRSFLLVGWGGSMIVDVCACAFFVSIVTSFG